jgi:peptidyl-prolyl cis-trans isomerase B (cyclophilin B)
MSNDFPPSVPEAPRPGDSPNAQPYGEYSQQPQGYAGQPQAGQPYAGQPYGFQQSAPPMNTLAVVSFVLSLASLFTGITAIGGVITGHIALRQIRERGEGGRGFALAGTIIGWALIAIGVLAIVLAVIFIVILGAGAAATAGYSGYSS